MPHVASYRSTANELGKRNSVGVGKLSCSRGQSTKSLLTPILADVCCDCICIVQGVSENTDTFVLTLVSMILSAVSWDKHLKIGSSMEIC